MGKDVKEKIYCSVILAGCLFVMALLIKFPEEMTDAARRGIDVCAADLIPTLFPFLAVTSFLRNSGAIDFVGKKTEKVADTVFKTSGTALGVFLISLFSGFPVGASMVCTMTEEKTISKKQGARLMTCCVNAGPAFVISTVGVGMLRSKRAGIILFASLTAASVIIFFVTGLFLKEEQFCKRLCVQTNGFSASLVNSVSDASKGIVSVCGWVILFSCLSVFLKGKAEMLTMFFEVTFGCRQASNYPLPITALVIGWGGLCVHCQVFRAVLKSEIKKTSFFFFRLLNGALSAGICSVLLRLFPCSQETFGAFAENVGVKFSSNALACVGLLLMCAILIVDFEEARIRKGQSSAKIKKIK